MGGEVEKETGERWREVAGFRGDRVSSAVMPIFSQNARSDLARRALHLDRSIQELLSKIGVCSAVGVLSWC